MNNQIPFYFLMASERSGSNLITRMIANHSQMCGPAPSHIFRVFGQNIENYGNLSDERNWIILLQDINQLMEAQLGAWASNFNTRELAEKIEERTLEACIRYIYTKEAETTGKKKVFIKENRIFFYFDFIRQFSADGKFIHLVRDPRDMALSWKKSPNHPGGIMEGCQRWNKDQENYLKLSQELKQDDRYLLIRYEDLITDTDGILNHICEFLDIPFEVQMGAYFTNPNTIENSKRISNWENLSKPILSRNYNKYTGELATEEIKYIESICVSNMQKLGYKTDLTDHKLDTTELDRLQQMEQNSNTEAKLTPSEAAIREKRIHIINKVLSRKLV